MLASDKHKLGLGVRPRPSRYPNGAYKVLAAVLYGSYPYLERRSRGVVILHSPRALGALLGTKSIRIRGWIHWLESQGYLESVSYLPGTRAVQFRVREPHGFQ